MNHVQTKPQVKKKDKKTNSDQLKVELGEGLDQGMKGMKNQELATEIEKFSIKEKLVSDLVMKSTRPKRQSRYRVY